MNVLLASEEPVLCGGGGGRQAGLVHCGKYSCVTGELLRADSGSQLRDRGNRAGAVEGKTAFVAFRITVMT